MSATSLDQFYSEVIQKVMNSAHISVAVNEKIEYIAVNPVASTYLKISPSALIGKSALDLYPEITASKNHRNILKALSGHKLEHEHIESRMGDVLITSYLPCFFDGQVKAIVLEGKLLK